MAQPSKRSIAASARKLQNAAKVLGIDLSTLNIPTPEQGLQAQYRRQLEAESVLYYVEARGAGFKDKTCKECGGVFSSTALAVAYCTDVCRYRALEKIGVAWNPHGKSESERWNGRIPKTVPPSILPVAKEAIKDE